MERQDAKTPRRQEPDGELDRLAHEVIGAAIEVHKTLHAGLPESVYEEALCIELAERGMVFERQAKVNVFYRERLVGQGKLDIWVENRLVVELKAVEQVLPKHKSQVRAYLVATGCQLGLLINFHEAVLKDGITRVIHTPEPV